MAGMLSGVMLIIVTMFAVLGAYYLSDLLTVCLFKTSKVRSAIVLLATDAPEQMWNSVLAMRNKLPESEIIVLYQNTEILPRKLEPGMQRVLFATPETVGTILCGCLAMGECGKT
ncbi:MAG: hypothetical protein RSC73_02270 [Ruthenibacterium sp.]